MDHNFMSVKFLFERNYLVRYPQPKEMYVRKLIFPILGSLAQVGTPLTHDYDPYIMI